MRTLEECRSEIDRIDRQIVALFEERMLVSRDVADCKQKQHMEILNPEREEAVLRSRSEMVKDPELRLPTASLYRELMRLSREEQRRWLDAQNKSRLVGYMGIPGAFSESAVVGAFGEDCPRTHYKTFEEVFSAVADRKVRCGLIPVENSSSGSVNGVYDLMGKYNCHIIGEQLVRVEHCLLGVPGGTVEQITSVFSHDQGFAQCPDYLGAHPAWKQIPYFNTAIAAKHVAEMKDPSCAAIGSSLAAKHYGLDILAKGIQSSDDNHTRFVIVSASPTPLGTPDKATLTFTLRHERGTLMRALSSFNALGLNLTHIESRPLHDCNWEYMFYADVVGNVAEDNLRVLLESLAGDCEYCRLLGAYKAAGKDSDK